MGMAQLLKAAATRFPNATVVPIGEYVPTDWPKGPMLQNYWTWPSVNGRGRACEAEVLRCLLKYNVRVVIGMRSGALNLFASLGSKVVSIDREGERGEGRVRATQDGLGERWFRVVAMKEEREGERRNEPGISVPEWQGKIGDADLGGSWMRPAHCRSSKPQAELLLRAARPRGYDVSKGPSTAHHSSRFPPVAHRGVEPRRFSLRCVAIEEPTQRKRNTGFAVSAALLKRLFRIPAPEQRPSNASTAPLLLRALLGLFGLFMSLPPCSCPLRTSLRLVFGAFMRSSLRNEPVPWSGVGGPQREERRRRPTPRDRGLAVRSPVASSRRPRVLRGRRQPVLTRPVRAPRRPATFPRRPERATRGPRQVPP